MTITGAIVLFAVFWFMGLLIALPIGLRTQGEEGEIVEGTHASSPVNPQIRKKMKWVTIISILLWIPICLIIYFGVISIEDIDVFNRLNRPER